MLINYGLRIGELLLLTIDSIKKLINLDRYSLVVTYIKDEHDERARKPQIKNNDSNRVIELSHYDQNLIKIYIENVRKNAKTKRLFTSLRPPYNALSYASVNTIFKQINDKFKSIYPHFYDVNKIDAIEKITPHVCRHTWAYRTFKYAAENYQSQNSITILKGDDYISKAKDDLRALAGWSADSHMPNYYARRFISERANLLNLNRIMDGNNEAD